MFGMGYPTQLSEEQEVQQHFDAQAHDADGDGADEAHYVLCRQSQAPPVKQARFVGTRL